jgi:hypothetical protein
VLDRPDYVDLLGLVPGSQVGVTRTTFGTATCHHQRKTPKIGSGESLTNGHCQRVDPSSSSWVFIIAKSLGSFYEDDMPFLTFLLGSVIFFGGNDLM